jgi:hypothetical protein
MTSLLLLTFYMFPYFSLFSFLARSLVHSRCSLSRGLWLVSTFFWFTRDVSGSFFRSLLVCGIFFLSFFLSHEFTERRLSTVRGSSFSSTDSTRSRSLNISLLARSLARLFQCAMFSSLACTACCAASLSRLDPKFKLSFNTINESNSSLDLPHSHWACRSCESKTISARSTRNASPPLQQWSSSK